MDVVVLIGRILFGLLFLGAAYGHLAKTAALAEYAASKKVPVPKLATLGGGVVILAGGLMVILGVWADLGAALLVLFLLPTAFVMHGFWSQTDAQTKQAEMTQFQKDVALAGAALMFLGLYVGYGQDLDLTITGPLFR